MTALPWPGSGTPCRPRRARSLMPRRPISKREPRGDPPTRDYFVLHYHSLVRRRGYGQRGAGIKGHLLPGAPAAYRVVCRAGNGEMPMREAGECATLSGTSLNPARDKQFHSDKMNLFIHCEIVNLFTFFNRPA